MRRLSYLSIVLIVLVAASGCGNRLGHRRLLSDSEGAPRLSSESASRHSPGSVGESGAVGGATSTAGAAALPGAAGVGASGGPAPSRTAGGGSAPASGATIAAGTPAAGGCAATRPQIVIGSVGEISGIIGQNSFGGIVGVQTWTTFVNDRGGIHCHPLKYIALDDGGDPSRNQALTRQLVEQNHAIALVWNAAPLGGSASIAYLQQKRVPAIGSETASQWYNENSMYFPQATSGDGNYSSTFSAFAQLLKPQGKKKVALVACVEAAICSRAYSLSPSLAAKYGLNLVYRAQASLATPDFTAHCQAAKNAGADAFYLGADSNSMMRLARSCASIGYQPLWGIPNLVALPGLSEDSQLDGLVATQNTQPWFNGAHPGVAEFQQAMKRYSPGEATSAAAMAGWVSGKLFETAAKNLSEPPTSASLLDGLWAMRSDDLAGLTMPLTYAREKANPLPVCYWIAQIKAGTWVSPNGFERSCP